MSKVQLPFSEVEIVDTPCDPVATARGSDKTLDLGPWTLD